MSTMRRWRWAPWVLLGIAGGASCAELPPIAADVCGNGFVDLKEDCDSKVGRNGKKCSDELGSCVCRQAGKPNQCQWYCDSADECAKLAKDDNAGWGCGIDHVCRRPQLCKDKPCPSYSEGAVIADSSSELMVGDFDGSGKSAVLSVASPIVNVHYCDSEGHLAKTESIVAPDAFPAVGDLTKPDPKIADLSDPKIADFAFIASRGLSVMRGSSDEGLLPTVYAALTLQGQTPTLFLPWVKLSKPPSADPDPPPFFYLRFNDNGTVNDLFDPDTKSTVLSSPTSGTLAGDVLIERFFSTGPAVGCMGGCPCAQYAFASLGGSAVTVFSPCQQGGVRNSEDLGGAFIPARSITLPVGAHICAPNTKDPGCQRREALHATDVDHDGKVDLVISAMNSIEEGAIYIAFNRGDGTFHSSTDLNVMADNKAGLYAAPYLSPLPMPMDDQAEKAMKDPALAVGDLNEDCALDFVNAFGIYMSYLGNGTCTAPQAFTSVSSLEQDHGWTIARIAEMTGDQHLDVVVGSADEAIQFYSGTGTTLLSPKKFAADRSLNHFTIADLDGDSVLDLAFAGSPGPGKGDALSVMFGNPGATPSAPVSMGETSSIRQIMPTSILGVAPDAITDLLVVAERTETDKTDVNKKTYFDGLSLFPGSSDRELRAPFYMFYTMGGRPDIARRVAIGQFGQANGDGTAHLDFAALGGPCDASQPSLACTNLWLLPSFGEADLFPSSGANHSQITLGSFMPAMPSELTSEISREINNLAGFPIASVNLGPTTDQSFDTDEVVLVVGGSPPSLYVAHVKGTAFELTTGFSLGAFTGVTPSKALQLIVADMNRDNKPDVVVASPDGLLVLWNRDNGSLDANDAAPFIPLAQLMALPCGDRRKDAMEEALRGVAALNLDADPEKELVVLTSATAYFVDYDDKDQKLVPRCQEARPPAVPIPAGAVITSGDVNGDGVDDIIVGRGSGIHVFLGKPADPGNPNPPDAGADAAMGAP